MKKKMFILSTTFMISLSSMMIAPNAKANTDVEITEVQEKIAKVNEQIKRFDKAIKDNEKKMTETENKITSIKSEMDKIQKEIIETEKRMNARNEILSSRMRSFQENGGNISYLEVLLGSSSFGNFVSRIAAVSTIINADQQIMEEHKKDVSDVQKKREELEKELKALEEMKIEFLGMNEQINEQKKENERLKESLKQQEKTKLAQKASQAEKKTELVVKNEITYNTPSVAVSGDIQTVIGAGYKYIGNSVYVFGGGRNAYDIANGRFDCSGFVHWAFAQAGVNVGSNTDSLKNQGVSVSVNEIKPGDLVFFDTYKKDGHVGIYIGGGQFIGSQSSTGVAVANMSSGYWKSVFNGRVKRIL